MIRWFLRNYFSCLLTILVNKHFYITMFYTQTCIIFSGLIPSNWSSTSHSGGELTCKNSWTSFVTFIFCLWFFCLIFPLDPYFACSHIFNQLDLLFLFSIYIFLLSFFLFLSKKVWIILNSFLPLFSASLFFLRRSSSVLS